MAGKFARQLQKVLLALLLHHTSHARIIRGSVDLELWDDAYEPIAAKIYDYVDKEGKAPGTNAEVLFADILNNRERSDAARQMYQLLDDLEDLSRSANAGFAMARLSDFVRRQAIKAAMVEAIPIVQSGDNDRLDEVENLLREALRRRDAQYDPGINLGNIDAVLASIFQTSEVLACGIRELDAFDAGPVRKGLHVLIGAAKAGKSWWLIHLGRTSAERHLKVLHLTLEMSQQLVSRRYVQTMFAIAKRDAEASIMVARQNVERRGAPYVFELKSVAPPLTFDNPKVGGKIRARMEKVRGALSNIQVREFPTGNLTVSGLLSFIDQLADRTGFIPDLVIVDYPDLMKIGYDDFRLKLGQIYKDLRGAAVERNLAMATVSQSSRKGAESRSPTETSVAEDWSKIATADTVLVLRQTKEERMINTSRIWVADARSDRDKFEVGVSQNYAFGQFALSSYPVTDSYWKMVPKSPGDRKETDEEDDDKSHL